MTKLESIFRLNHFEKFATFPESSTIHWGRWFVFIMFRVSWLDQLGIVLQIRAIDVFAGLAWRSFYAQCGF
ncbi:MAG: hypothetical protein ACK4RK_14865 [Gemmataceae bacterium]